MADIDEKTTTKTLPPKVGPLAFTADLHDLAFRLGLISRAASGKTTLPVLNYVLLASDRGRLRLSATNLALGLTTWLDAKIAKEGAIALPVSTFGDLISSLGEGTVEFTTNPKTQVVSLKSSGVSSKVKGIDAMEFPSLALVNTNISLALDAKTFSEAIHRVSIAAAKDMTRPYLTGVLVHSSLDGLTLACGDNYRLAVATVPVKNMMMEIGRPIIPAKWAGEIVKIVEANKAEDAVLYLDIHHEGVAAFRCGDAEVAIQLLEGEYPDYASIIPTSHTTRLVYAMEPLRKFIQAIDVIAREVGHSATLEIKPPAGGDLGMLMMESAAAEVGEISGDDDVTVEGERLPISFNLDYLADGLRGIGTPQVSLECSASNRPCIMRPVGASDFMYMVMPVVKQVVPAAEVPEAKTEN
jgi:DNA polymerase-3 subunit beta